MPERGTSRRRGRPAESRPVGAAPVDTAAAGRHSRPGRRLGRGSTAGPAPTYAPLTGLRPARHSGLARPLAARLAGGIPARAGPRRRSRAGHQPRPGAGSGRAVTLVGIAIVATLIAVLVSANTGSPVRSKSSASGGTGPAQSGAVARAEPDQRRARPARRVQSARWARADPAGLAGDRLPRVFAALARPVRRRAGPGGAGAVQEVRAFTGRRPAGVDPGAQRPRRATTGTPTSTSSVQQPGSGSGGAERTPTHRTRRRRRPSRCRDSRPRPPSSTTDSTTGISIGAFTTVGRYQVVVILSGLAGHVPTNATVVAAEAAKVMKRSASGCRHDRARRPPAAAAAPRRPFRVSRPRAATGTHA